MAEAPKEGSPPSDKSTPPGSAPAPAQLVGNPADYIDLKLETMRATLTIKANIALTGFVPQIKEEVTNKLAAQKVTHGIDWAMIDQMVANKIFDRGVIIAAGTPAKLSRDAVIKEKLKIDPDVKPVVGSDGKADYKNVDNIQQVTKGDVLAIKIPMQQGENGNDIYGKVLPAAPGKDVQFKVGTNTEVSADGLQLIAAMGGYAHHQGGAICVGVTYVHKGNVDFKSGNLHYQGDIHVQGNVTTGFTVEAQGHVLIEGNVDSGDIVSHNGNVTIKEGVFGHGKGRIIAKGDVHVLGAQDMHIYCENGTLSVEKGLRNCMVFAHTVKADSSGCSVVGGEIRAYGDVIISVVGGEGARTIVRIVDKEAEAAKEKIKEVEKLKIEVGAKVGPIETRLKRMKAMAIKFGGVMSDRSKADLKAVLDQYAATKAREKELEAEKEVLMTLIKSAPKHQGKFVAAERIVWGVVLEMYGRMRDLSVADVNKEWIWDPEGMADRTSIPENPDQKEGTPPAADPPS